jgi:MFS family permease
MVGILGNQSISPALPSIGTAFGVGEARVGLVITAFYLATAGAVPIVGVLADLYGRRPVIITSLGLFGLTGVGAMFAPDFRTLVAIRALQGVAFCGITPITVAVVGDLYTGAEGSTAQGLRTSSHGISNILAPALGGFLAGILWSYPFLLFALAFPAMGLVYLYLPETAAETDGEALDLSVGAIRSYLGGFRAEFTEPTLGVLILGVSTLYFIKTALMTFLPLFVVTDFGATAFVAGLLLSLRGVIRVLVSPLSGVLTARFGRNNSLYASFGLLAAGMGIVGISDGLAGVVVATVVFSLGDATGVPLLNDTVTTIVSTEQRAGVVSLMNSGKLLANAAAPAAFGVVLSVSDYSVMFLSGVVVVLGYGALLVATLAE